MSKQWLVELHGDVREVYAVDADTEAEAREKWTDGSLVISEAESMVVTSVREDE